MPGESSSESTCSLALAARPQDRLNISWKSPIPHIPEVLNATYRTRPPLTTSMDRLRKTSVEACNLIATLLTLKVSVQRPDQVSLELRLAVVDGVC